MYGLYGLKHHTVEISGDVTDPDGRTNEQTTSKYRATQLLIHEPLSFANGVLSRKLTEDIWYLSITLDTKEPYLSSLTLAILKRTFGVLCIFGVIH